MFRAFRASSRVDVFWRLAAPLLTVALVTSTGAAWPETAVAGGTGTTVASIRAKQRAAEADMRRADHQIKRLLRQRHKGPRLLRAAKRKLDTAIVRRRAAERKADKARGRLGELRLDLARKIRVHPHPAGKPKADKPKLRKRVSAAVERNKRLSKQERAASRAEARARSLKRSRLSKPTKARIAARKSERERAEDRLASAIAQMASLARQRAARLGASGVPTFRMPARGRISQGFGCTGSRTNPWRGGCRYHDGIDIAAPRGTQVRAAASGFVAYAGFSPWDGRKRAFVVIIGHAAGFETVYAHLQPRDKVRAGQRVKRGQVIGSVGMTGHTTGPHVHWEVKRWGTTVNPLRAGR